VKVQFTDIAKQEYMDAIDYYNSQRDGLGYEFAMEIDEGIQNICLYVSAWQKLSIRIRRYLIKRFPFGIIYSSEDDTINVLSIMNLHQKPKNWNEKG
jgi:toxin ParE1/3/4